MEDQQEVFAAAVMDPSTENIRLGLECPDPNNPRNRREATAVAVMCQFAGLEVPDAALAQCNNRQPPCPYRRLYTKAPWSENKTKANNYAVARDRHYGLIAGAPGSMQGVMAHATDSAIANLAGLHTRGYLVTLRDPEDIQTDLDALQARFDALQTRFDTLTTTSNTRIAALTTDVTNLRNERHDVRRTNATLVRERDDARQGLTNSQQQRDNARQHLQAANDNLNTLRGEVQGLRTRLTNARTNMTGLLRERRRNAAGGGVNPNFISPQARHRLANVARELNFDGAGDGAGIDSDE